MSHQYSVYKNILLKTAIDTNDQQYFASTPYYRAIDGTLVSDFDTLKSMWPSRIIGKDFTIIEKKDHLLYYQMTIDDYNMLYGKILFEGDRISYLYETILDSSINRYLCTISYDGTLFEGYQKQVGKRTVQGTIEDALKNAFEQDIQVHASGRTDKGVHAYHQPLHFDLQTKVPTERLHMVIGQYLPEDIVIQSIKQVPPIFHARYDTTSKTYMYHLDYGTYDVTKRNYRWYVDQFDIDKFKKQLTYLIGEHDFAAFTKSTEKDTIRTIIDVSFEELNQGIIVRLKGRGFLRYMVRYIMMAAYLISKDELDLSMEELLEKKDNTILRRMASPCGLYLDDVTYD